MTSAERTARIEELRSDLAQVREAQRKIVAGGQAYSGEGRMMTRADLAQLGTREQDLAQELSRLQRGRAGRTYSVNYR